MYAPFGRLFLTRCCIMGLGMTVPLTCASVCATERQSPTDGRVEHRGTYLAAAGDEREVLPLEVDNLVMDSPAGDNQPADIARSQAKEPERVFTGPIDYVDGLIFAQALVNQAGTTMCLIDTSSPRSAIQQGLAAKLALEPVGETEVHAPGGRVKAPLVQLESISLYGATATDMKLTARNTKHRLVPEGAELGLILGTDFLSSFIVRIDFEFQRIDFLSKSPACENWIPMPRVDGVPQCEITLDGDFTTKLQLNTSVSMARSRDVYLNLTQADERRLLQLRPGFEPAKVLSAVGPEGRIEIPVYQFGAMQMGDFVRADPFGTIYPAVEGMPPSEQMGFFTCNLLHKFPRVVLDFSGSRLGLNCKPD